MKKTVRKVLVIRFSSIGDIVLTTPVLRCLKKQSGVEIHYLTKSANLPLLQANPYIDKLFAIEKKVSEVLPTLRQERYDALIDLHKNWRSLQIRLALRVRTLTFDKLNWQKWLLVNFKINRLPQVHIVDRYLQAVAPFGVKNDGQGLDFFGETVGGTGPANPKDLSSLYYIAFAIGAKYQTKRLPTEKIIAICKNIHHPVVLLGGKEEAVEGENIARQAGNHVLNFCGKLTLGESASVLSKAAVVISHDTGMMHVAAAFGKKILSVWGNTVPAFGMTPYFGDRPEQGSQVFEVKNLPCRPCSKIGFQRCPKGHFRCMNDIDTAKIAAAVAASVRCD